MLQEQEKMKEKTNLNIPGRFSDDDSWAVDADLESRREESVEAYDERGAALEQTRHPSDHSWSVDSKKENQLSRVQVQKTKDFWQAQRFFCHLEKWVNYNLKKCSVKV